MLVSANTLAQSFYKNIKWNKNQFTIKILNLYHIIGYSCFFWHDLLATSYAWQGFDAILQAFSMNFGSKAHGPNGTVCAKAGKMITFEFCF